MSDIFDYDIKKTPLPQPFGSETSEIEAEINYDYKNGSRSISCNAVAVKFLSQSSEMICPDPPPTQRLRLFSVSYTTKTIASFFSTPSTSTVSGLYSLF